MNPKRFFVDEPKRKKLNPIEKKLGIYFKQDTNPGYYKDGYFFDVKSTFTGWTNKEDKFDPFILLFIRVFILFNF